MLSKLASSLGLSTTTTVTAAAAKPSKKRAALGDISNQPAAVKAAKARRSSGGAAAAAPSAAPDAQPTEDAATCKEVLLLDDSPVRAASPRFLDIYAGDDAVSYRELATDFFAYLKEVEVSEYIG